MHFHAPNGALLSSCMVYLTTGSAPVAGLGVAVAGYEAAVLEAVLCVRTHTVTVTNIKLYRKVVKQ